ncbi:ATP-dependent helicase [Vibrio splendidus]
MNTTETVEDILRRVNAELNPEQREAAQTMHGALLILAGAGSGKTKTLIHRAASMIISGISPKEIMMLTFTNKAAGEIKARLEEMPEIGINSEFITAGTFHSVVFHKILQPSVDSDYLYGQGFNMADLNIMDESDSDGLMKQAFKSLSDEQLAMCDTNHWTWRTVKERMGPLRAKGLDHQDFALYVPEELDTEQLRPLYGVMLQVWTNYSSLCRVACGVDFDDILVYTNKMLKAEPERAEELSQLYKYIMLDEYQDTNPVQQSIFDVIAKNHSNICCVGDEKQSIYGFRGSDISVIMTFLQRYSDPKMIELPRNYRSYPEIVFASNALVKSMQQIIAEGQMEVESTITESPHDLAIRRGNTVAAVEFDDDYAEADTVCKAIMRDIRIGVNGGDIAVLYRNKTHKDKLEEALVRHNVPYELVGDTSYYKKKEVKDFISLLRFVFRQHDSAAGLRFLESSSVGVSVKAAKTAMFDSKLSVSQYLEQTSQKRLKSTNKNKSPDFTAAAKKVQPLMQLVKLIKEAARLQDDPYELISFIQSLWNIYQKPKLERIAQKTQSGGDRKEEPKTIRNVKFALSQLQEALDTGISIDQIIDDLVFMVDSNPEAMRDTQDQVKLMTLHASKGLEFDHVYMISCDQKALLGDDAEFSEIEEARRLHYVGMTRAKKKLLMSYGLERRQFGEVITVSPCQFFEEIEQHYPLLRHTYASKEPVHSLG